MSLPPLTRESTRKHTRDYKTKYHVKRTLRLQEEEDNVTKFNYIFRNVYRMIKDNEGIERELWF